MKQPTLGLFKIPDTWHPHWSQVAGVHIGGCVDGTEFVGWRQVAHTHFAGDPHERWICLRHPGHVYRRDGKAGDFVDAPSAVMVHELAHVMSNKQHRPGEEIIWAETMLDLLRTEKINPVMAGDGQLMHMMRARKRKRLRETYSYTY